MPAFGQAHISAYLIMCSCVSGSGTSARVKGLFPDVAKRPKYVQIEVSMACSSCSDWTAFQFMSTEHDCTGQDCESMK